MRIYLRYICWYAPVPPLVTRHNALPSISRKREFILKWSRKYKNNPQMNLTDFITFYWVADYAVRRSTLELFVQCIFLYMCHMRKAQSNTRAEYAEIENIDFVVFMAISLMCV